jgi:hypothetical protein
MSHGTERAFGVRINVGGVDFLSEAGSGSRAEAAAIKRKVESEPSVQSAEVVEREESGAGGAV